MPITFTLTDGERGSMSVFDVGGRLLDEVVVRGTGAPSRLTWPANGRAPRGGVCFVELRSGNGRFVCKAVVIR